MYIRLSEVNLQVAHGITLWWYVHGMYIRRVKIRHALLPQALALALATTHALIWRARTTTRMVGARRVPETRFNLPEVFFS